MDKGTLTWQDKCERYICTLPRTDSQISKTRQNFSCEMLSNKRKGGLQCVEELPNVAALISMHGFPFVVGCRHWFGKFVWSLICLGACGTLSYFCYLFAWEFISQREIANVWYDSKMHTMPIPTVTICNLNPLKRSTLSGSVFENLTILDDQPPLEVYEIPIKTNTAHSPFDKSIFNSFHEKHGDAYVERLLAKIEIQFHENFKNSEVFSWEDLYKVSRHTSFSELRRNIRLTREQFQRYGHKPMDTLISGNYDDILLDMSGISDYVHPIHGRCFSLKMILADIGNLSEILSVTLNLEADEYISFLNPSVGAVLSVHDPDEGFTESSAIKVVPGEHTHVTITLEETTRPEPCALEPGYTIKECQRQCLYRQVKSFCGCSIDFDEIRGTPCMLRDKNHYVCSRFLEMLQKSSKLPCVCPNKCKENLFKLRETKMKWPSDKHMPHLIRRISTYGVNLGAGKIRDNIAEVSFTMDRSFVKKIRFAPQITLLDLLVRVGGLSAILTGISVITVLEILWVLCVALGHCCSRTTLRRKSKNDYSKQTERETTSSGPKRTPVRIQSHQNELGNIQGASLFQRKDSNILRRISTRKRLGANRRRSNRSESRTQQQPDIFITPFPILTSTVRQNKNTSSGESGVASINRLISNHRSSDESLEHHANFRARMPSPVAQKRSDMQRIVPRLNLQDLASNVDMSGILCQDGQRVDTHLDHDQLLEASRRRDVINSDIKGVFNGIRRHHSDASDLRQLVYQPTRFANNTSAKPNRFFP